MTQLKKDAPQASPYREDLNATNEESAAKETVPAPAPLAPTEAPVLKKEIASEVQQVPAVETKPAEIKPVAPVEKVEPKVEAKSEVQEKTDNANHREELLKIRQTIEKVQIGKNMQNVSTDADDVKQLEDDKKIAKLMDIARHKGLIYAFSVAKVLDDPYVLDKLHDELAQDGAYKKFKL